MDQTTRGAAARIKGELEQTAGQAIGDAGLELKGRLDEVKGMAVETYGRAIDEAEKLVERMPEELQDGARRGVDFARRKPLVTTGILAGALALLLGALGRRRR